MRARRREEKRARVLVIRAAGQSHWRSMNQIHRRLEEAYRTAFPGACTVVKCSERRPFRFPPPQKGDRLVLLDHHLEFPLLLDSLAALEGPKPALTVHLFSDFLTRRDQISAARELRERYGAVFVAASRWLRDAVLSELPGADVRVVPFPVGDVFFKTPLGSPSKRLARWAYAGRIHPDKGLDQFLENLLRSNENPLQFRIWGSWSDNRYESWSESPQDFVFRQNKMRSLIGLLGLEPRLLKTEKALARALSGIDACVYPSIFKGEEFGYALAQSLAAGKACWISDWRGHRDFSTCPGVRMIPVSAAAGTPKLDFGALRLSGPAAPPSLRRRIRNWARGNHSILAVAAALKAAVRRS